MTFNPREVAEELYEIVNHEDADAILMNDWLFDGSLPVPSIELTVFVTLHLLRNEEFLAEIGTLDLASGIRLFVTKVKALPFEQMVAVTEEERCVYESEILAYTDSKRSRIAEWAVLLPSFNWMLNPDPAVKLGMRAVTRRALDALTMRALYLMDTEAISGLAEAMKIVSKGEGAQVPLANRVASSILGWQRCVRRELGQDVAKTRMKEFLMEIGPHDFSSVSEKVWASAFQLARWNDEAEGEDRKGPRNKGAGTELAKRINDEWEREKQ